RLRHLTRSTLFPYTTLFRSTERQSEKDVYISREHKRKEEEEARRPPRDFPDRASRPLFNLRRGKDPPVLLGVLSIGRVLLPRLIDRKSTRLNSSHVKISYAV